VEALGPIAAFAAFITIFAFIFLNIDRKKHGGFWVWQRSAMRNHGRRGEGKVLSRVDRGQRYLVNRVPVNAYDLVVEITLDGGETYRVSVTLNAYTHDSTTAEGQVVPLFVDPKDRERVMIDFSAIEAKRDARQQRDADRAEEKRRRLLAERPPSD
jgi:hypothetical protein